MATLEPINSPRGRERELVKATRALFDERGVQEAPVEEIARTVGIARGLIYRSFSSKQELYVLTVTDYLHELDAELRGAVVSVDDPVDQLRRLTRVYAEFGCRYPAFLDCALSLMRGSANELRSAVSESVWLRLGRSMALCTGHLSDVLRDGARAGRFAVEDPDYTANVLWTQALGVVHLTRLGAGLRQVGPGIPELFPVTQEQVVTTCIDAALALAAITH